MKNELQATNPLTKQKRKHTIAADKGTAPHDATRQVVTDTYIDDKGQQIEVLITCEGIHDKTGYGIV